jgi:phenylpyruvate tautomerase
MPFLKIVTNVPESKIPPNYHVNLTNLLQELLQKPIEYCSVQLQPGQIIAFGGSHEPCAFIQLGSIGRLGPKGNLVHSEKIMTELENTLGIYPHLTYIHFIDLKPTDLNLNISDSD